MKKVFVQKKILPQLIFWSLSFIVLFRIFTKDYNNGTVDFIYTLLFHVPLLFVVVLNYKLIDKLILNKKYVYYSFSVLILLTLGVALHFILFDILASIIFPGYYFISMFSYVEISQYLIAYIIITLLIKLSSNWFELREKQSNLEKENNEVQLRNLKAQLNPHFLFNSLNNIYSLSNFSEDKGKEYIIKLSDALRYMLYKTSDPRVPLKDELEYLNNYIELEKLRLEQNAIVTIEKSIEKPDLLVSPLILLPIIENAFKHCNKHHVEIEISISQKDDLLELICKNTIEKSKQSSEFGGLGLENLKKRLNLIYPNKHQWNSDLSNSVYSSHLSIILSE